jgi:hypothetical protein
MRGIHHLHLKYTYTTTSQTSKQAGQSACLFATIQGLQITCLFVYQGPNKHLFVNMLVYRTPCSQCPREPALASLSVYPAMGIAYGRL